MPTSPTQRCLALARKEGYAAAVVEKMISIPGGKSFRRDLFGVVDIMAVHGMTIVGIQACAASGHAAHRTKLISNNGAGLWLYDSALRYLEIWSWSKRVVRAKSGKKLKRWKVRKERIEWPQLDAAVRAYAEAYFDNSLNQGD